MIISNYIQSWKKITSNYEYEDPEQLFGIKGFITGIPYMMMNSLFDGPEDLDLTQVKRIIQYYKGHQLPMMWFIGPEGLEQGIDALLYELDIEQATMEVPGMALDLEQVERRVLKNNIEGCTIRQLEDDLDSDVFTDIFMQSFEVDPSIQTEMEEFTRRFVKHPTSAHYILDYEGVPVTTASVVYDAGVAGIYNVATLKPQRGRGLATSLMSKCLLDAQDRGYRYSILHSSAKGKSIYEQLGYEVIFTFQRYLLRPADVGL